MVKARKLLPLAAMEKILKTHGAERVADNAKEALREVLEDIPERIAVDSVRLALHARRKTVKAEDVKLAVRPKSSL